MLLDKFSWLFSSFTSTFPCFGEIGLQFLSLSENLAYHKISKKKLRISSQNKLWFSLPRTNLVMLYCFVIRAVKWHVKRKTLCRLLISRDCQYFLPTQTRSDRSTSAALPSLCLDCSLQPARWWWRSAVGPTICPKPPAKRGPVGRTTSWQAAAATERARSSLWNREKFFRAAISMWR